MAFADSSEVRVAYVPEAAYGVTPATPSFKQLRLTGGGLSTNKTTGVSNERRPDRNVSGVFETGQDVTGDLPFELTYGSFDDIFAAALFGDWSANKLKNGKVRKSFTFEETIELGVTDAYSRFTGVMVNSLSLSINARAEVTGTFSLMGQKEALDNAPVTGATYADPATTPILTASANIANFQVTGLDAGAKVRSISLQIANNLRTRPVVGSKFSEEFGAGRCEVSGTVELYFSSNALYQKVLDHGSGSLSFEIGIASGEKYRFTLPKLIFGNGPPQKGGNDADVMISLQVQAVFDPTTGCSIMLERAIA